LSRSLVNQVLVDGKGSRTFMLMAHAEIPPTLQKFGGDNIIGILRRLVEVTHIDLVLLLKSFESNLVFEVILGSY
jgi:hypothetical protein